jgi:hypothetical protein
LLDLDRQTGGSGRRALAKLTKLGGLAGGRDHARLHLPRGRLTCATKESLGHTPSDAPMNTEPT